MTLPLPAEIELMAACCRWPPSEARQQATQAAAASVDWNHFDRVVGRHRVAGLVADGLRRAEVAIPAAIAASAAAAARQTLNMARETVRLQQAFDAEGVSAIFVKGTTLALLAYRELAVKQAWDIDLLVDPANAVKARLLLENLGYRLARPLLNKSQFSRFLIYEKECVFINDDLGVAVELHWRLITPPNLLPDVTVTSQLREVLVGGWAVRTLAEEPLFAYLSAHGTIHGWARLKWIADVNALIGWRQPDQIEQLYRSAVQLGGGRTPGVALLLCHKLFGLSLERSFRRSLQEDRKVATIAAAALCCISHGRGAKDFGQHSATGLRLIYSQLFLVPGAAYTLSQLGAKWRSSHDRTMIQLPRRLEFLYHVIRVPMFLWRLFKRSCGRLRA